VPWARGLLQSDSGPFSGRATAALLDVATVGPARRSEAAAAAAAAGGGGGGGGGAEQLAPPARRRRDMLVRLLRDQYGQDGVRLVEEGAAAGAEGGGFALAVALDDKSALVRYAPRGGFAVQASEGADERVRLGAAVERACELVDEMFRPIR
jgi:hypothetical protein